MSRYKAMRSISYLTVLVTVVLVTGNIFSVFAALQVYMSRPGIQTAEASFATSPSQDDDYKFHTEQMGSDPSMLGDAFNAVYTGSSYVGDYTLEPNNIFGGYNTGDFMSITGPDASVTLVLGESVNYFGFLWTAGDAANQLSFYNAEDKLIGVFTAIHLMDILMYDDTSKVYTVDNNEHYTGYFYGQPNNNWPNPNPLIPTTGTVPPVLYLDPQNVPLGAPNNVYEPYAFVHFINDDESTAHQIKKIVFTQLNESGFESDNHTIRVKSEDLNPKDLIFIKTVPEPNALGLLVIGVSSFLLHRQRKHQVKSVLS